MVTEMDYLRRSARILRRNKITNSTIRDAIQITKDIINKIEEMQLRWYGYVMRRENKLNKETLLWEPQGRRKRGRPQPKWRGEMNMLMQKRGLTDEDWKDRDNW